MDSIQQRAIADAINQLWVRFLPDIEARVAILEQAAAAYAEGVLTPGHCEQASAAAHKLAGVLGTFGLSEGTTLAREAEALYLTGFLDAAFLQERPMQLALQLRATIAGRKQPS